MSDLQLTKTNMKDGVWQGVITGTADAEPRIAVTHENHVVKDVSLTQNEAAGHWVLSVPIPAEAIADGVHTLLIVNQDDNEQVGHITLIAGDAVADDIRAEIELLRAELDMLKRAFRRHCVETA